MRRDDVVDLDIIFIKSLVWRFVSECVTHSMINLVALHVLHLDVEEEARAAKLLVPQSSCSTP